MQRTAMQDWKTLNPKPNAMQDWKTLKSEPNAMQCDVEETG